MKAGVFEFKLQQLHEGRLMEKEVKRIKLLLEQKMELTMNELIKTLALLLDALRETAQK